MPNPNFWQRRSPSRGGREPKRQPDLTGDKPCCCRARKLLRFLFLLGKHSFEKLDFFLSSRAMWSCKKTWVVGLEVSYVRKQLMVLRKILVARKLASTSSTLWSPQLSLWRATRCLNGIRWCCKKVGVSGVDDLVLTCKKMRFMIRLREKKKELW